MIIHCGMSHVAVYYFFCRISSAFQHPEQFLETGARQREIGPIPIGIQTIDYGCI